MRMMVFLIFTGVMVTGCGPRDGDSSSGAQEMAATQPRAPGGTDAAVPDSAQATPPSDRDPSGTQSQRKADRESSIETADVSAEPKVLEPFPHITVRLDDRIVEIAGWTCLEVGWLEQIVCTPNTREHESLVVTPARPSSVHAALLMAGYEPGRPGRWSYENETVSVIPPEGDAIEVLVRYERDGETITEPVRNWIRDHHGRSEFPQKAWIFGGSSMEENPLLGDGPHYVADLSGSVIGLVTFGDEVLGFPEVLPDAADVRPPEWEVNTQRVPPPGTPVTIVLSPAAESDSTGPGVKDVP